MIEKSRLEELIEQGATIYYHKLANGNYFDVLDLSHSWVASNINDLELDRLFETKEELDFDLEFGNITRTETLSLPTFEDFMVELKGHFKFIEKYGHNCVINGYYDEKLGSGFIDICVDGTQINDFEFSKESYVKACELAKKLFLGVEE